MVHYSAEVLKVITNLHKITTVAAYRDSRSVQIAYTANNGHMGVYAH